MEHCAIVVLLLQLQIWMPSKSAGEQQATKQTQHDLCMMNIILQLRVSFIAAYLVAKLYIHCIAIYGSDIATNN